MSSVLTMCGACCSHCHGQRHDLQRGRDYSPVVSYPLSLAMAPVVEVVVADRLVAMAPVAEVVEGAVAAARCAQ